jgi:hypothetical protein
VQRSGTRTNRKESSRAHAEWVLKLIVCFISLKPHHCPTVTWFSDEEFETEVKEVK